MKIVYVIPSNAGGLGFYIDRMCSELKRYTSVEIVLIVLDRKTSSSNQNISVCESKNEQGLDVYTILNVPSFRKNASLGCRNFDAEKVIYGLIAKIEPDIMHFHSLCPGTAGLYYGLYVQGIKTILTLHDSTVICHAGRFFVKEDGTVCLGPNGGSSCFECFDNDTPQSSILRYNYIIDTVNKHMDAIISVSNYIKNLHIANGITKQIDVIKSGFEAELRKDKKRINTPLRLMFAGRLNYQKGALILLEALRGIDSSLYKLDLYGDGSELFYKNILKTHYPDVNFEYCGKYLAEDKNAVYDAHDILVMPSIGTEAAPLTQLEAYSRKVPCVVSSAGGLLEYVMDKGSVLFESGNIEQLHKTLKDLVEKPEKVQKMSDNIELSNLRTFKDVASDHIAIYEKVLAADNISFPKTHASYEEKLLSKGIRVNVEEVVRLTMIENSKELINSDFYIFGTGNACKLAMKNLVEGRLLGFFDNNSAVHGQKLHGYDIMAPFYREKTKILIASVWSREISGQLTELGYDKENIIKVFGD